MEKLSKKLHSASSKVLRDRSTWRGLSNNSRICLLETVRQRHNFSLSIQSKKTGASDEKMRYFPPLELALLRSEYPLLLPSSVTVNLWQHYQIVKRMMSSNAVKSMTSSNQAFIEHNRHVTVLTELVTESQQSPLNHLEKSPAPALSLLHAPGRPLKNVFAAADAKQKRMKERSSCLINEHFEPVFNTATATQIAVQQPARTEISPAQYFKRSSQSVETVERQPQQEHSQQLADHSALSEGLKRSSPNSLADMLFDRAMQSQPQLPSDFSLRILPSEPARMSVQTNTPDTKSAVHNKEPIQLNRNDITRVADQVTNILNQRKRLERERKGEFY